MGVVTKQALRVYAALSNFREQDGDVLDALIPFFEPILKQLDGKRFDAALFASGVRHLYNWRFTKDIAERFVPRLAKKGYLESISHTRDYIVRYTPPSDQNDQPEALTVISKILEKFEQFPNQIEHLIQFKKNERRTRRYLYPLPCFAKRLYGKFL